MSAAAAVGVIAVLRTAAWPRASAAGELLFEDDRILGAADAPITIIEYSSLTCPHCAKFHTDTLPQVKEHWIATGKARIVYRHFPFDACFADQREMDRILARAQDGQASYEVQSTPTFIINGRKVVGAVGYEEFNKALEEAAAES